MRMNQRLTTHAPDSCRRKMHLTAEVRVARNGEEVRVTEIDESQLEVPGIDPDRSIDATNVPRPARPELQPMHPLRLTASLDQFETVT